MALFGDKKKNTTKKTGEVSKRRARTATLTNGVAHEVVRAPWFSEKALVMTDVGVYTFAVPFRVNKAEVAGAIKEIYKVTPRLVRIVNLPAKRKALRNRRGTGVRAARRKAYVYLAEGDTIQFV